MAARSQFSSLIDRANRLTRWRKANPASHWNLMAFIFFNWYVGNTNVFKYGASRVRSGKLNGIANINFSEQTVTRFECDMTYNLLL